MLSRHFMTTFAVVILSLSATACSSLTRPDEITIKAEPVAAAAPPPAPAAPAGQPGAAAAPAPGGGG
ncbi:hypothetical protein [Polyangium spumosum]|uniref:Uncharacterized protein n=1 Tax=Polyangium spumosum TaxID=889282 RepID=A0A6N7PVT5_9BACT|nr:hypothetical protein [Polyangium spumosum]MRG96093.1 hypothetical protein [Polyangium spumosum]